MDDHDEEKRTEQNLSVRSGKPEAEVTNNRRLRSTYCTIEANYWRTRSIARPLCDSRATCSIHRTRRMSAMNCSTLLTNKPTSVTSLTFTVQVRYWPTIMTIVMMMMMIMMMIGFKHWRLAFTQSATDQFPLAVQTAVTLVSDWLPLNRYPWWQTTWTTSR